MTDPGAVTWHSDDPNVLVLTLRRPPANALGRPIIHGLGAALDAAGQAKVLVIRSELDRFFAAGADIKEMSAIEADAFTAYGDALRAVLDRLAGADLLSIAAVDGMALGGGLEVAMACTLRVAGRDAQFGLPEVKLGLIPGAGGTQRLPRLVGRGRALDLMLTGRAIGAEEAHAIGLVDRLVDAGQATKAALELAGELAALSLPAQQAVVRSVDAAFDRPLADGLRYEVGQIQDLFAHGEATEGISAFVAKRPPRFS
ncbi:MAG: enoyl-CoA hydratase/isomerase family protein [Thermocrispum sp.]